MIEHHIQRTILDRLMHAAQLRFSELKPDGMESNIFMYHLKQLIKDCYVEKDGTVYRLAAKGLTYVDGLSNTNKRPRHQPKLIAVIALQNPEGKWLLAERKIQPYIGKLMFPSGKQHRGETRSQHAARELQEKTGLEDIALTFRGTAEVQIHDASGELLTHVVANVYQGRLDTGYLPRETERFRYVWHDFEDTEEDRSLAGDQDLYKALQQPGQFNLTIVAHL